MTTRLNTPGPDLAVLPGVHALTDITGFGLAGHTLFDSHQKTSTFA